MKKQILTTAIAMALGSTSLSINAQNVTYVGNLPSTGYSSNPKGFTAPIFSWDGQNNGGLGWGHTSN